MHLSELLKSKTMTTPNAEGGATKSVKLQNGISTLEDSLVVAYKANIHIYIHTHLHIYTHI